MQPQYYSAIGREHLLTFHQEGPTARLSAKTMTTVWGAAATAINAVKAEALDELAAELRRRPALRGVPATVDASALEARAAELRGHEEGSGRG
jgi:hypothetical protein